MIDRDGIDHDTECEMYSEACGCHLREKWISIIKQLLEYCDFHHDLAFDAKFKAEKIINNYKKS